MARLAISSAMALGGSIFGVGASYGWLAGSALGNLILGPRTAVHEGPRLKDFSVPQRTYGSFIPVIYGAYRLSCPLLWLSDVKEAKTSVLTPGKGNNLRSHLFTYSCSIAVAIGEGVIDRVLRIWADDQLIYDATQGCVKKYDTIVRIYSGTEDQLSDPTIESYEGIECTPAYRGLAYIVFEDFPLGDFGNRIPHFCCEVSTKAKRTYSHQSLKLDPLQHDNTVVSEKSPFLYHAHGGVISKIDRKEVSVVLQRKVLGSFSTDTRLVGRLAIDSETEEIYTCVEQGHSTFIAVFDYETLKLKRQNEPQTSSWSHETELYITNKDVWSADAFSGQIRCYTKASLGLKFSLQVTKSLCTQLGNFTEDDEGNVWFISSGREATRGSILTKVTPQGHAKFFGIVGFGSFNGLSYDTVSKSLIIGGGDCLLKINPQNGKIIAQADVRVSSSYAQSLWASQARIKGILRLKSGTKIILFDTKNLRKMESIDAAEKWGVDLKGMTYDPMLGGVWTTDGQLHLITFENYKSVPLDLNEIVTDLCRRSGLREKDIAIQFQEKKNVIGFALGRLRPTRQHLSSLASLFFFEGREDGNQLIFISPYEEGRKAIRVRDGDLCVGSERAQIRKIVHAPSTIPRRLTLTYLNQDNVYEPSVQQAEVRALETNDDISENYSVPIVLSDNQAQLIAENLLKVFDASRFSYSFLLPPRYAFLRRGDVLDLHLNLINERVVITSLNLGANNQVEIEATRLKIFDAQDSTGVSSRVTQQKIYTQSITQLALIDSPSLFEGDSVKSLYLAAAGLTPHWRGAEVFLKTRKGDYQFLTYIPRDREALIGMLTASLNAGPVGGLDEVNELKVKLPIGSELVSYNQEDVLEGGNLLMVGTEILQFTRVKQLDDTHWVFSGLLRGRKGTEHAVITHEMGERVVFLDEQKLICLSPSKSLDAALSLRAVTLGKSFESGIDVDMPTFHSSNK